MYKIEKWMLEMAPEDLPEPYCYLEKILGVEATLQLARELGGETVYFRKLDAVIRNRRNVAIIKEYNGFNLRQLASKYGITQRQTRKIITDNYRKRAK